MAKSDKEGYGAHGCHTPPAFAPVLLLRLRIASGGYDCPRECACTSGWLPLTSHHSHAKDDMSGRSPLPDATTAWPAHTLEAPCCLHRLHSVTCLHYRRRLESIIIRSTASSTSVSCQAQRQPGSLHCIPLALILTRHVHNPTLSASGVNTSSIAPAPSPSVSKGQCWKP